MEDMDILFALSNSDKRRPCLRAIRERVSPFSTAYELPVKPDSKLLGSCDG